MRFELLIILKGIKKYLKLGIKNKKKIDWAIPIEMQSTKPFNIRMQKIISQKLYSTIINLLTA